MSLWHGAAQRFGRTRAFATIHRRLAPLDARLMRRTQGRWSTGALLGLPQILLTTTGRKTGQPRTVPLLTALHGSSYVVIGSNYGADRHPAWALNLEADPDAVVRHHGRDIPVRARVAKGEERQRLWDEFRDVWPAYDTYADRSGRDIRVFVLEPRADLG
jgi:deazaflavin-dependent oxidoreductase (nitroreductase family)